MSPGPLAPQERPRKKYTARSYSRRTLRPPNRYSARAPRIAVMIMSIAAPPQAGKASTITATPWPPPMQADPSPKRRRSEEHTSELQSRLHLVCRLLLEKKKKVEHRL